MNNNGLTLVLLFIMAALIAYFVGQWLFSPVAGPPVQVAVQPQAPPLLEEEEDVEAFRATPKPVSPELAAQRRELRNLSFDEGSVGDKLLNFLLSGKTNYARERYELKHNGFLSSETQISSALNQELSNLAAVLKAYPDLVIEIAAHTGMSGTWTDQQGRTQARADLLRDQLVDNFSVPAAQVEANGKGASYVIADGQTERGRLLNERVEFRIVRF